MSNNGHWLDVMTSPPATACNFQAPLPSTPTHMHGGPLTEDYILNRISFKGGKKSEHHVNGNHKRLEIQFVHYRQSAFTTCQDLDNVVDQHKGLVIMSVLVNRGKANIEVQKIIDSMNRTVNGVHLASYGAPTTSAQNFSLAGILPKHYYKSFYTYQGSLSAPPCTQSVTWIVPKHYITMSSDQLYFFSEILSGAHGVYGANYRLEQPMGPRMVSRSFGSSGRGNNNLPFGGLGIAGAAAGGGHGGHGGHHGR